MLTLHKGCASIKELLLGQLPRADSVTCRPQVEGRQYPAILYGPCLPWGGPPLCLPRATQTSTVQIPGPRSALLLSGHPTQTFGAMALLSLPMLGRQGQGGVRPHEPFPWCCVLAATDWSPRYPLYQLGNPQLRVFRTNFFIQLVRPGTAQPDDTVQFRIPMEMTRVDLRNYLERIYNVPVSAVRTRVQHGSNRKRDHRNVRLKKPDYKVAYVQLAHGQTFTFPDLFPEKKLSPEGGSADDNIREQLLEAQQRKERRDPQRGGVPEWFGL